MTKRIELTAPTSWGELTRQQLVDVAGVLCLHLQREEMLVTLFCLLANVRLERKRRAYVLHHGETSAPISIEEIADLSSRFGWAIDTEPDRLPNPSQADDFLRDTSFGDWFEADTHFRLYEKDEDQTHFDIILPLLKEQPRKMDKAEAKAYLWWWRTLQQQLAEAYPNVLERKDEPDQGETPEAVAEYDPFKQLQNFHLLLNEDKPQENERIDNTRLHDVLSALDNKILKLRMQQEELEKLRRL